MKIIFAASLSLVCACGSASARTIDGQVFIVTAGGSAVKLALVEVGLFAKSDIEQHIRNTDALLQTERPKADATVPLARQDVEARERAAKKVYAEFGYARLDKSRDKRNPNSVYRRVRPWRENSDKGRGRCS